MNFGGKIVMCQFVQIERRVTVESGLVSVLSLCFGFWQWQGRWCMVLWFLFGFKVCCGEVMYWLVSDEVRMWCKVVVGASWYGCCSMDSRYGFCLVVVLEIILMYWLADMDKF